MYGIVNRAIEELVITNFGPATWEAVKTRSGIDIDFFIGTEPYDDRVTYQLAEAISAETGMTMPDVMTAFGEWWVLKTGKERYGSLMEAGGENLREFLVNLPQFHNRIMLIYPKLMPPEFKVSDIKERSLNLHYFSKREGLQDFVQGLLVGLSKMYNQPVNIKLTDSRLQGSNHEVFNISW